MFSGAPGGPPALAGAAGVQPPLEYPQQQALQQQIPSLSLHQQQPQPVQFTPQYQPLPLQQPPMFPQTAFASVAADPVVPGYPIVAPIPPQLPYTNYHPIHQPSMLSLQSMATPLPNNLMNNGVYEKNPSVSIQQPFPVGVSGADLPNPASDAPVATDGAASSTSLTASPSVHSPALPSAALADRSAVPVSEDDEKKRLTATINGTNNSNEASAAVTDHDYKASQTPVADEEQEEEEEEDDSEDELAEDDDFIDLSAEEGKPDISLASINTAAS